MGTVWADHRYFCCYLLKPLRSCSRHSHHPCRVAVRADTVPRQKTFYQAEASVCSQPACSCSRGNSAVLTPEQNMNNMNRCLRGKGFEEEELFCVGGVNPITATLWALAHPTPQKWWSISYIYSGPFCFSIQPPANAIDFTSRGTTVQIIKHDVPCFVVKLTACPTSTYL